MKCCSISRLGSILVALTLLMLLLIDCSVKELVSMSFDEFKQKPLSEVLINFELMPDILAYRR